MRNILYSILALALCQQSCNSQTDQSDKGQNNRLIEDIQNGTVKPVGKVTPVSYEELVALKGKKAEELFNKASNESDIQTQIRYYTEAINYGADGFPNYCSALVNRGSCKKKLEDYRGALADYNLAIDACSLSIVYCYRGECKMYLRDKTGAIADFDIAIKSNLNDDFKREAYLNKGTCLIEEDKEKACENWSIAGQMGSSNAYDFIKKYCN